MHTATLTIKDIMHAARARHEALGAMRDYLADPGDVAVPASFNRLAYVDFAVLSEANDSAEWEDYCPAYAMALLTYGPYYREVTRVTESDLFVQWNALCGSSRLTWKQAQAVIARAWNGLAHLEREGSL